MMLDATAKPRLKSLILMTVAVASIGAISATAVGIFSLRSRMPPAKPAYALASTLATPQEIDRVIQTSINLSSDFTAARIANKLLATELVSGGTTFIIYRFNFPQTCGKAGCLHVAVDKRSKVSIPLQLFDLADKTIPFTSLTKAGCFSVKQPVNGSIETYEICQSH
jgi:hypothetical protein